MLLICAWIALLAVVFFSQLLPSLSAPEILANPSAFAKLYIFPVFSSTPWIVFIYFLHSCCSPLQTTGILRDAKIIDRVMPIRQEMMLRFSILDPTSPLTQDRPRALKMYVTRRYLQVG